MANRILLCIHDHDRYILVYTFSINTVEVLPVHQVYRSVPGGDATFRCTSYSQTITGVQWLVNGTHLENLNLTNVTKDFNAIGRGVGTLKFKNLPVDYDRIRIRCEATLPHRITVSSINFVVLRIVQGI